MKRIVCKGGYRFGEMIKEQRLEKEISITGLALITGFSAAAISRWERGERIPSVETFNAVMKALGAEICVINIEEVNNAE